MMKANHKAETDLEELKQEVHMVNCFFNKITKYKNLG